MHLSLSLSLSARRGSSLRPALTRHPGSPRGGRAASASAAGRPGKRAADFGHPVGTEHRDRFGQEDLLSRESVGEDQHTLSRHTVGDADRNLGRGYADRSGSWHRDHIEDVSDQLVTGKDQGWPGLFMGWLIPPDLATSQAGFSPSARAKASAIVSPCAAISSSSRRFSIRRPEARVIDERFPQSSIMSPEQALSSWRAAISRNASSASASLSSSTNSCRRSLVVIQAILAGLARRYERRLLVLVCVPGVQACARAGRFRRLARACWVTRPAPWVCRSLWGWVVALNETKGSCFR